MSSYNDRIIAEFRANHGTVGQYGDRLVIIHSTGARSGEERLNPTMALSDGDGWLVIASAAGAPKNPAWYHNLVAHPEITIEVPAAAAASPEPAEAPATVAVTATELHGTAHEEAFARFVAASPTFAEYQERAGSRTLPIFRLAPRAAA